MSDMQDIRHTTSKEVAIPRLRTTALKGHEERSVEFRPCNKNNRTGMVQGETTGRKMICWGVYFLVNLSHAKVIWEKQAIKNRPPLNQAIDKPVDYFIN